MRHLTSLAHTKAHMRHMFLCSHVLMFLCSYTCSHVLMFLCSYICSHYVLMFLCSYVLMFSWLLIPRLAEHEFAHASLCGRIALAHDGYKLVALEECLIKRNASSCIRMHVSYESYVLYALMILVVGPYARMFLCS